MIGLGGVDPSRLHGCASITTSYLPNLTAYNFTHPKSFPTNLFTCHIPAKEKGLAMTSKTSARVFPKCEHKIIRFESSTHAEKVGYRRHAA